MKSHVPKRAAIVLGAVLGALACAAIVALALLQVRTDALHDDWRSLLGDGDHDAPARVEGVEAITQDVSCGYAVIEMFSAWDGGSLTEEDLYGEHGGAVTSTGASFCEEMNKRFPRYETAMRKYLTDSELLDAVYRSLEGVVPVPFE